VPPNPSSQHPDRADRETNAALAPGRGANDVLALTVNGDALAVASPCTIAALLIQLGLEGHRVAVAVDRDVIPRSSFATHRLAAGDRIEILEAVGGG